MDAEKGRVLLIWLNCLELGPELTHISQLFDGRHVCEILKIIWVSNSNRDQIDATNWIRSLQSFLEDYYRSCLSNVVVFDEIGENSEWELSKATLLLLCASIHCSGDPRFVNRLIILEQPDQLVIKTLVESVFFDGVSQLNSNFVDVLRRRETFESCELKDPRPNSQASCYENDLDTSGTESNQSQSPLSPIRQLMQSPQMIIKLELRDKERRIHNLESELDAERSSAIETESELHMMKQVIKERETCLKVLKRECDQFQEERLETARRLQELEEQLKRANMKIILVDNLTQELRLLTLERESLVKEKVDLEVKVNQLEAAYKGCEKRTRDYLDARGLLCCMQSDVRVKGAEITRLQSIVSELQTELAEVRQINAEKLSSLQEQLVAKPESQGEVMSVITEKYLQELRVEHVQLQSEFDAHVRMSEQRMDELRAEKMSIEGVHRLTLAELEAERDQSSSLDLLLTDVRENAKLELVALQRRTDARESELREMCDATKRDKEVAVENYGTKLQLLSKNLKDKTSELQLVSLELSSKSADISSLEADVTRCEKIVDTMREELVVERSRTNALEEKVWQQNVELDAILRKSMDEKLKLDLELKASLIEGSNLRDKLSSKEVELRNVQSKLVEDTASLQEDVKRHQDEVQKFRVNVVDLEVELEETKLAKRALYENKASLEAQLEATNQVVAQLADEIRRSDIILRDKLVLEKNCLEQCDRLTRENSCLKSDLKTKIEDVLTLQEEMTLKDVQVVNIERALAEETTFLKQSVQQRDAHLENLGEDLAALQRSKQFLEQEISKLEIDLQANNQLVGEMEDAVSTKDALIRDILSQVKILEDQKLELEVEKNGLLKVKYQLEEDLKAKLVEISQLQNDVNFKDCKLADLNDKFAQSTQVLKINIQQIESSMCALKQENADLKEEMCVKDNVVSRLEDDLRFKVALIGNKLAEEKNREEKLKELAQNKLILEELVQESAEAKKRLEEALNAKLDEISILQDGATSKDNELVDVKQNFSRVVGALEVQLRDAEDTNNQLEREVASLNVEMQATNERVGQLEMEIVSKDSCIRDRLAEAKIWHEKYEQLARDKGLLESIVQESEEAQKLLKEELRSKLSEISTLQDEVMSKDNELCDVTKKFSEAVVALETKLRETESSKCQLIQERINLSDDLEAKIELVGRLEDDVRTNEALVQEKLDELKCWALKFDQLALEKAQLESRVETIEEAKKSFEHDLELKRAEVSRLEVNLKDKVDELGDIKRKSEETAQALESKVEESETAKCSLEQCLASFDIQLKAKTELVGQLEGDVRTKDAFIEGKLIDVGILEEKMKQLVEENAHLEQLVEKSEEAKVRAEVDLQSKVGEISLLKDEVAVKKEQLNKMEQKLVQDTSCLQESIEQSRLIIENFQSAIARLELKNQELTAQLKDTNQEHLKLKDEGANHRTFVVDKKRLSIPTITTWTAERPNGMVTYLKCSSTSSSVSSDIEKSRRRSASSDMYCSAPFLNRSTMKLEVPEDGFRRSSLTMNGSSYEDGSARFELDIPNEDDENVFGCQLDGDSLEDVQTPFGSQESLNEKDSLISQLTSKMDALTGELNGFKEKEAQWEVLKKHTDALLTDNRSLEVEVEHLRERLNEQAAVAKLHSDLPNVVQELKRKVFESEQKSVIAMRSIKNEYDHLKMQYDVARRIASEAKNGKQEREIQFNEQNQHLEEYKRYADSKKQQLIEAISLLKQEKETAYILGLRLQEEEKKLGPYVEKLREQEMTINRHINEKRSLETQLDLASQKLREFQKLTETQRHVHSQNSLYMPPKIGRQSSASLSNMRVSINESTSSRQSALENMIRSKSASTRDLDDKVWCNSDASMISNQRAVPSGVGNYFACEDEEGEFHNVSYLDDLKRGACDLEHPLGRLTELQRRNTLCRPHLKTSYPVETQMNFEEQFTEEDLKTGNAVEDRLMETLNETMETAKRKIKPSLPSYHKPGPPTPGRASNKLSTQTTQMTISGTEKLVKTPSSIRKLFRRTVKLGTPKQQYRVTPKKNAENVPPEPTENTSKVRKNIAFQLGFSPKPSTKSKRISDSTALKLAVFNSAEPPESPFVV